MRKLIVTFFGTGLSPIAPGTAGSLATTLLLMGIYLGIGQPSFLFWQIILLLGLLGASAFSVVLGPWAIAHFQKSDPQPFVLDEVAGICLTNLFLPMYGGWRQIWPIGIAFVAFRLFDVTKPPPARQLEHLPAGWGILLDDLAAAVYANILCQLLLRLALNKLLPV
jgi:phosphatidylglycerophosphatase A